MIDVAPLVLPTRRPGTMSGGYRLVYLVAWAASGASPTLGERLGQFQSLGEL